MSHISPDKFDGGRVWASLTPDAQARIGAAALEYGVALNIAGISRDDVLTRAAMEAVRVAEMRLGEEVYAETSDLLHTDDSKFHLPTCIGFVCERCGCSHYDPCDEGCGWHDVVTCTACV